MSRRMVILLVGSACLAAAGCGKSTPEPSSRRQQVTVGLPYTRYNLSWDNSDRSFVYKIWAKNSSGSGGTVACSLRVDDRDVPVAVLPDRVTSDAEVFVFVDGTLPSAVTLRQLDNFGPECSLTFSSPKAQE